MGVHLGPRYQCIRVLGSGGMGRVFLVHDAYLEKDLALKLLQDLDARDGAVEQMQKEFAILSELEHPGIARAHDFGYLAGRPYFTSEYVPGEALGARGPIEDVKAFLKLARDIADAVAFLHRSEILHLDIKPSNIIVSTASTGSRPMLIDFGVFRRGIGTLPGSRIQGSIPYMAPECFKGDPLGPWTDIYALGATLYRLATGSLPRGGASEGSRIFEPDW